MKRCPKCSRTFPDENQKFCTFDGGLLRPDQPAFDPNLTVRATSKDLLEPKAHDEASEAKTSVRLQSLNETITSFGTQTFPENTDPGSFTSGDLGPPQGMPAGAESAPTSTDLSGQAPAGAIPPPPAVNQATAATAPVPQVPATATAPPPTAKKKSVLPWVLAALVLLLLLGGGAAVAGYFLVVKPMLAERRGAIGVETANTNSNTNTNTNSAPSPADTSSPAANANVAEEPKKEPEPFVPPANAVQFTNSSDNLDGDLAKYYVGFSFYYPQDWVKDPKAGVAGSSSYAKVDSQSKEEAGDYLQERVLFTWYPSKGSFAADTDVFPARAKIITDQLSKSLPNFEEVSRGETTVNAYKGYEVRFKGVFKNTGKGDLPYWGRVIFLPPGSDTAKGGVAIVMLATSLAQDVTGAKDVGDKGGMALILDSFRFANR